MLTACQINVGHRPSLSVHQSYKNVFSTLRWLSLPIFWRQLWIVSLAAVAAERSSVYDFLLHPVSKHNDSREGLAASLKIAAQRLKVVSANPIISATSSDVLFTIIALCTWAFIRNLSVDDMLDFRVPLPFSPKYWKKEKELPAPKDADSDKDGNTIEVKPAPTTPRKRGRPRKNGNAPAATSTSSSTPSTAALRRSTRRKTRSEVDSEPEESFEPSPRLSEEVTHTDADGSGAPEDVVAGGEAAALGLFLTFIGGLGELTASVLGAEAAGSSGDRD
jgi:hypothetical protein